MCSLVEKICRPIPSEGVVCLDMGGDNTWYYDAKLKKCLYGTGFAFCAGNDNIHRSENECMLYCAPEDKRGT